MARVIWVIYAATVGLMLLASFSPGERLWAFNWYGYFPWYGTALLVLVGIISAVCLALLRNRLQARPDEEGHNKPYWPAATVMISALVLFYIVFSGRTHFLGDGYQLLSRLEAGALPIRPWNLGAYFLTDNVYSLLGGAGESRAELTFRIISCLSGLLFLTCAALTATLLYRTRRDRLLFLAGIATGGYALLFFGYVENYPPLAVLVAAVTFLGLLAASGKLNRWWIVLPAGLSLLFHPFAVAVVPGVLYILFGQKVPGQWYRSLNGKVRLGIWVATVITGILAFTFAYHSSTFFRFAVLPPVADRFTVEGYTLFSGKHLLDFVNLLFLLFPGLLFLLWALVSNRKRGLLAIPEYQFLLILLIPSMLIIFLFNPTLGMPRDWDVFSFAGIPLVTSFVFLMNDTRFRTEGYVITLTMTIALGMFVLIPRVISQYVPETSIAVFDSYSNLDVIRNASGRFILLQYLKDHGRLDEEADRERANLLLSPYENWDREGRAMYRDGRISQAEEKFRQAIDYAPNYAYSWANIGVCFSKRGQWDSALTYFEIADGLNPFNSDTYNSIGFVYLNVGDVMNAEKYFSEALRLRPSNFTARGNLLKLYVKLNRRSDLVQLLLGVIKVDSVPPSFYYESVDQLLKLGENDAASRMCRRALESGCDTGFLKQLEMQHPGFKLNPDAD